MKLFLQQPWVWKILFCLGLCPFLVPFAAYLYEMAVGSSFTLADWLILYSFLYWWTYGIGLVLCGIAAAVLKRNKKPEKDANKNIKKARE